MNAMIRGLKGTLAVLALVGLGLLLRWMTAGSIDGARTYDLDSLTVLAVGTVAWIAYAWLVLAVLSTALEQIPGVVGELAGVVAGRITTKTARALLRSGLGVAAVTPLTVGAAQATPTHSTQVLHVNQPAPAIHLNDSNWRPTEPTSRAQLAGANTHRTTAAQPPTTRTQQHDATTNPRHESANTWRSTEPASRVQLGAADAHWSAAAQPPTTKTQRDSATEVDQDAATTNSQQQSANTWRSTEPASRVQIGSADAHRTTAAQPPTTTTQHATANSQQDDAITKSQRESAGGWRAVEPASELQLGGADVHRTASVQPPTTKSEQDNTITGSQQEPATTRSQQESTTTKSQRESAGGWRAMEPASELQLGGADVHQTAAAQPPTTKSQYDNTTDSRQQSTNNWRSTEPASRVQIGGADAHRTTAEQPPTGKSEQGDASTKSQEDSATTNSRQESGSAKSQRESAGGWRAVEPGSELQVGGLEAGAKSPTAAGRPAAERPAAERPAADRAAAERAAAGRVRVGVPDRPTDGAPTRYTEVRAGGAVRVVVRDGDSLWGLAARELGAGASDEAIAARWPEWYAVNRHVIGDDPDLILPGQVLRVPPVSTGHLPPTHQEP
ncbi:LysM peptidoglycan-binding domain-containing protein [Kribbella sp. NPDC058693]|uniref:LysM peptidoglycan-binding domain-containing protein n=1 Tax=Kribbella sp. NPDC058693 TaxID=3346602 RepID=UPI003652A946